MQHWTSFAELCQHAAAADAGFVEMAMYRPDCPSARGLHGLLCLSFVGWFFTIFCTYTGFACMVWGEWPLGAHDVGS